MDALRSLLGLTPARCPPPIVESDDIFPTHMLDDTKTLRSVTVIWTMLFNDVLDADKLHSSLSRLLEIGDWRKAGGRLRLNKKGRLEIHVPQSFTAARPAVSYSHQVLPMAMEDHPLAKTVPKVTTTPSIHPGATSFRAFGAREDAPAKLEDFIYSDAPQLALHITSFSDGTLVGLSWPHVLMDVMGKRDLLHGWSLVMAGRESEVPPVLAAREDPIRAAADATVEKPEEFKLQKKLFSGWAMAVFGIRFAWDLLWSSPAETRTIFLPKRAADQLQYRAQADLAAAQVDGQEKPFVSEGDVLTAWATRAMATSLPRPRPVTVMNALNTRFRILSLVQSSGAYIQNLVVTAFTFLSPEVATGPLGHIALENRRHLSEQATEGQVLAFIRALPRGTKSGSDSAMMLCGEPNAVLMVSTNWGKANIFKTVNFGPAVVRAGETKESRINPPGTIACYHSTVMEQSALIRNVVVVLGKDYGGNYWLSCILTAAAWAKIEEDIEKM